MKVFVAVPPVEDLYPYSHVCTGLRALGHQLLGWDKHTEGDLLVTWSPWKRSRRGAIAEFYEGQRRPIIVLENGWLSPVHLPPVGAEPYFQVALNGWNGTGTYPVGGPERWDSWGVTLGGWTNRIAGRNGYALVIGQRGHPHDTRTMYPGWHDDVILPGVDRAWVIRRPRDTVIPLAKQLSGAAEVHVWSSNAATHALLDGVPVVHHGRNLMTAELTSKPGEPLRRPANRTEVFRRLAWGQWSRAEIGSGLPFGRILHTVMSP